MTAIVYRNGKTTVPGWAPTTHIDAPRGYAYETPTHFVHLYGPSSGLWTPSAGLVATEKRAGLLIDWALRAFGADDIKSFTGSVGRTVRAVWRPGLYFQEETLLALGNSEAEQRASEQSLRLLLDRLDELLLYIEPDAHGLQAYSHKTRELLILACTEVENTWKHYMKLAGAVPANGNRFTTIDYVKLFKPLFLAEFEVGIRPYSNIPSFRPFLGWDAAAPTQSLPWYDAYNKTKHDRSQHFNSATLATTIESVIANIVMFAVRFGPFVLLDGRGTLAALINQLFTIQLRDCSPETFYVPLVAVPAGTRDDLICGNRIEWVQPWTVSPLQL